MPPKNGNAFAEVASVPEEVTGQPRRVVLGHVLWRRTFSALRHRNFRLFFTGQLISLIGTWMQQTARGWLVYQLTGSTIWLGLVAAASTAPMIFFSVWGGSVADRHSKRNVVLTTQHALMTSSLVMAVLVWTHVVRAWHILALATCNGIAMAFDLPARQSFMIEMTSRQDLMNAISLNSSIVNGARIVGPSVAGYLIAQVGIGWCFFLDGLSYIAVIAGLCLMRLPKFIPPPRTNSALAHALEGFSYAWRIRRVKTLLILFSIAGIFGWSYSVLLPAFAAESLHGGEKVYSALLSANGIGALLGALTVATAGGLVQPRRLVFGGLGFFSAMLFALAFVRNYFFALVFLAAAGWGMLLFFSTTNTLIQTSVSDKMRGRVMGIWALIFGGMTPIGGLEAGTLSHYLGVRWAVAIGAMICALAALVVWLVARQRKPE